MFGYRDPLRSCKYVGGTMQAFCWRWIKVIGIIVFFLYVAGSR